MHYMKQGKTFSFNFFLFSIHSSLIFKIFRMNKICKVFVVVKSIILN